MRPRAQIGVGYPDFSGRQRFLSIVEQVLDRRWLTNNGPVVDAFERAIEAATGARNCIAVSSATTGLMVALKALDVKGRVAVPAFTFPATVHAIEWLGLEPVLCDIEPKTHGIDVSTIMTEVDAVLGVHVWGRACNTAAVESFAQRRRIPALFDAAPAFGARNATRAVGNFGRCEVFSFHATKIVNAIEGGAITTDDDELAERIRKMINFGYDGRDNVVSIGINAKLSEVHAAMGIASLELLERSLAHNRRNARLYERCLSDVDGLRLVTSPATATDPGNGNYCVVELHEGAPCTRDALIEHLAAAGIDARRYFFPGLHRSEPYASRYPHYIEALPITDRVCRSVVQLPTGVATPPHEVERICHEIRAALRPRRKNAANA